MLLDWFSSPDAAIGEGWLNRSCGGFPWPEALPGQDLWTSNTEVFVPPVPRAPRRELPVCPWTMCAARASLAQETLGLQIVDRRDLAIFPVMEMPKND